MTGQNVSPRFGLSFVFWQLFWGLINEIKGRKHGVAHVNFSHCALQNRKFVYSRRHWPFGTRHVKNVSFLVPDCSVFFVSKPSDICNVFSLIFIGKHLVRKIKKISDISVHYFLNNYKYQTALFSNIGILGSPEDVPLQSEFPPPLLGIHTRYRDRSVLNPLPCHEINVYCQ